MSKLAWSLLLDNEPYSIVFDPPGWTSGELLINGQLELSITRKNSNKTANDWPFFIKNYQCYIRRSLSLNALNPFNFSIAAGYKYVLDVDGKEVPIGRPFALNKNLRTNETGGLVSDGRQRIRARLAELTALHADGLISEVEFSEARKTLLTGS